MSKKYYFNTQHSEKCYTLKYHLSNAKDECLTEIELFEAIPEKVKGFFWCRAFESITEEGYCGKLECEDYNPKNGKSGMCRHKTHFNSHGKKVTFKIK